MDKCVQMLDKNHSALGFQTARKCICVLHMNRTREAEGDFCGLPMRRDEGRIVDPPLVFKRVFRRREKNPGWRELEESPEKKGNWTLEDRDWSGKREETLNAGDVGEPETMNAGGVGRQESMV
ncbi:hypothetical protein TNCV_4618641 [Trichonephila clavipes]|nr:hypothetical protein TNCV_4618641 [Trichonephila clavipes]